MNLEQGGGGGGGISPVLYTYDTWYGMGGWMSKPLKIQLVQIGKTLIPGYFS